jgi:type IV pilus assembly protein PilQ
VAANDIDAVISITLRDVALEEALTAILSVANYTWVNRDGIILITSMSDTQLSPEVQGRTSQIFDLDFISAASISETVTNFLSPIGKMTVIESDPSDNRRTEEMIVVEDIPEAIARIGGYIEQVDCPPRQVLIEAHILQVTLRDNERNGVNFNALARIAGARVNVKTVGFANPAAAPAFLTTIDGTDLDAVIELLQTTNDTKTLGSPKVLVLNQQEASVHVGEDLGYQTTVTSELQSTQAPQFLQIGVLLSITPRITRDDRVLLHVRPEVSTGAIDPVTQVPNKRTTELETDVMLQDGEGMVIGGLIDEQDLTNQSKVPYLGDLWRVGFLFRKSEVVKERKEVTIALVPRIQPYNAEYQNFEQGELVRAQTPLFQGRLEYVDRPYEAHLADGKRVAKPYCPPPATRPEVDRGNCNYTIAPYPGYPVRKKPFPREHLVGEPGDPLVTGPGDCYEPEGEYSGEFAPETGGYPEAGGYEELPPGNYNYGPEDGSIISDQP